jgi:hypothetical protein
MTTANERDVAEAVARIRAARARMRSAVDRGKAFDAEVEALLNEAADEYRPQSVPNVTLKQVWEARGGHGWGALEEALRYGGGK